MVALAQSAEHWIVAPEVTGSSPVGHPTNLSTKRPLGVTRVAFHFVALPLSAPLISEPPEPDHAPVVAHIDAVALAQRRHQDEPRALDVGASSIAHRSCWPVPLYVLQVRIIVAQRS